MKRIASTEQKKDINEYIEIELVQEKNPITIDCSFDDDIYEMRVADNPNLDADLRDYIVSSGTSTTIETLNADKVILTEDILCAGDYTQVGNITKSLNGTYTIPAKNKTLSSVIKSIFTKVIQPTKTEPSISISFPQAGAYEIGTEITPSYTVNFNPGSYTYGPDTEVQPTAYAVTDVSGNSRDAASASFPAFTVESGTNYNIKAEVTHTSGVVALDNVGEQSDPIIQIASGKKTATSASVTGYRCIFYGVLNDLEELTSDKVRAMTNGGKATSKTFTIKVNGNNSAARICVLIPTAASLKIKTVMKTDGLSTDITSTYSKTGSVKVDGKNNHNLLADYDIWTYQPAKIDSAEVHQVTIG